MAANCIALEIKTFSVHEAVLFLEQLTTIVKATHISWAHILAEQCRRRTTGTVRAERKHQDYDFIWFDILYIYIFHSGNNCFFLLLLLQYNLNVNPVFLWKQDRFYAGKQSDVRLFRRVFFFTGCRDIVRGCITFPVKQSKKKVTLP